MSSLTIVFFIAFIVASTVAFRPIVSSRFSVSKQALEMSTENNKIVSKVATAALTFLSSMALQTATPALAANYGGFGSTYAAVIDPKDAVFNDETKGSEDVKAGVASLNEFQNTIKTIIADLEKDSQTELNSRIKKDLPVARVRNGLNKFNSAFSEDTQRGTDRLIRTVVQDLTELDRETAVKEGKERSANKVRIIQKRLEAASSALADLSAFYSK